MRTPLAWKNLSGDLRRLVLGALGVGFAVVLMYMQNGFKNALMDSPVRMFELVDCDLIACSRAWYTVMSEKRFSDNLMLRSRSRSEVEWAEPLYFEKAITQIRAFNDQDKPFRARSIRVLSVTTNPKVFSDPKIAEKMAKLQQPMAAILDQESKPAYGFALGDPDKLATQRIELMDKRIKIIDSIKIGTDFANDGNILVSTDTFARCFPFRSNGDPLAQVDFGLIKLRPEFRENAEQIAGELTQLDPEHWKVFTKDAFIQTEVDFWNEQTPIGLIFQVGVIMGFTVGVIVCYQILFTNIHDSMSELATLKAMGYKNSYFLWFVIQQAFYLSVLGFLPATAISFVLFYALEQSAGLPMRLNPERMFWIYVPTLLMCVISGMLAVRKLWKADPASLF